MITQDLNNRQREELLTFYTEKVTQLQFYVLKMRRTLSKRQAQEQKWLEDLAIYQQRKQEGEAALQVLTESNPYYHKIRLDVSRCEIRIIELEIGLQRFTLVQKAEKIIKMMALEASISYYMGLIVELESKNPLLHSLPMPLPITDNRKHNWIEEDVTEEYAASHSKLKSANIISQLQI
jgi:hypothetical protein